MDVPDGERVLGEVLEDVEEHHGVEVVSERGRPQVELIQPLQAVPLRIPEGLLVLADVAGEHAPDDVHPMLVREVRGDAALEEEDALLPVRPVRTRRV